MADNAISKYNLSWSINFSACTVKVIKSTLLLRQKASLKPYASSSPWLAAQRNCPKPFDAIRPMIHGWCARSCSIVIDWGKLYNESNIGKLQWLMPCQIHNLLFSMGWTSLLTQFIQLNDQSNNPLIRKSMTVNTLPINPKPLIFWPFATDRNA